MILWRFLYVFSQLSSESSQLYSDEIVNQIRMDKQVLKTRPKKSQPFQEKTVSQYHRLQLFLIENCE